MNNIDNIIALQDKAVKESKMLNVKYRKKKLKLLKETIKKYQDEICDGLYQDLNKSKTESYMCEVGLVLSSLTEAIKNLKKNTKKHRVHTPLAHFASKSYKVASAYGKVLIISPWNYPFLLSIDPLLEAISAGNVVMLKTSEYAPATEKVIVKIISEVFSVDEACVVTGDGSVASYLLDKKFDYIFFTGSTSIGKIIYQKAAVNLTPVTLELGGKSPCVVLDDKDIKLYAKRIIFGKLLNAGQTCVCPDYIICKREIKDKLIKALIKEIEIQYDGGKSKDFPKIITKRHFDRIVRLIDKSKVVYGGEVDSETLKIYPTILDNVTLEDDVMKEEIFGPIIPIMTFDNLEEVKDIISHNPEPLAMYVFGTNNKDINYLMDTVKFGGGCINDTIIHLAINELPFGGVGNSGMGSYHGKVGFETFSHYKSVVNKYRFLDLPMRYQPYKKIYDKVIRMFMK